MYRWILALVLAPTLSSCALPCSERDSDIQALKELPADFFAALFAEAESGECALRCKPEGFSKIRHLVPPHRFLVRGGRVSERSSIELKWCFDEGLWLRFRGLGTPHGEIYVAWGGIPPTNGEALLWKRAP